MFLKLTHAATTNQKIRINVNNIATYDAVGDHSSRVCLADSTHILVKEKPEEIDGLLSSSYVMIKEAYENRTSEVPQHTTNGAVNDSEQSESGSC